MRREVQARPGSRRGTGRRLVPWLAWLALLVASAAPSYAQRDAAQGASALIAGLDYDDARALLAAADGDDPRVLLERARLAIYELDCDGATAIFARADVLKLEGAEQLADIARGCQRVTASLASDRDDARAIEISWQNEHDRALAPLIFDTVAKARDALTRDLGVDWPRPTRIVVVQDLLSLSAMTGLPYESAQTTGTVAVAKWGRVTLLSPRASHHGYPWRDTVAHELTHLAVTRASRDRAPLWLQEGVAKREEIRWRGPGPFDDSPPADAVAQRGIDIGLALSLDKLGPSIAMLPSADAATIAFAEVTSFVRFYAQTEGDGHENDGNDGPLAKLFRELRGGKNADDALAAASGSDLKAWDVRWRAYLAGRPRAALPALVGLGGASRKGTAESPEQTRLLRDLRERSRLAQLLMAREHPADALMELDRIELAGAARKGGDASAAARETWENVEADPSVRWMRGRALEAAGRREEGEPLMADPSQVLASYGPWWATRGRWARLRGDEGVASPSFVEAVAADPLTPETACETLDPAALPADPAKALLCAAARARSEPPFDDD